MEIAKYEADKVKSDLQKRGKAWVHRPDEGMDYLNMVVSEVKDHVSEGAVLLACGDVKRGGQVLVIGEAKAVAEIVEQVKTTVVSIKGGGKGGKWQGKVLQWQKGELNSLRRIMEVI